MSDVVTTVNSIRSCSHFHYFVMSQVCRSTLFINAIFKFLILPNICQRYRLPHFIRQARNCGTVM